MICTHNHLFGAVGGQGRTYRTTDRQTGGIQSGWPADRLPSPLHAHTPPIQQQQQQQSNQPTSKNHQIPRPKTDTYTSQRRQQQQPLPHNDTKTNNNRPRKRTASGGKQRQGCKANSNCKAIQQDMEAQHSTVNNIHPGGTGGHGQGDNPGRRRIGNDKGGRRNTTTTKPEEEDDIPYLSDCLSACLHAC